ncbi:MAG: amidohydrolase family protein [Acidimicrobiales bacterium]
MSPRVQLIKGIGRLFTSSSDDDTVSDAALVVEGGRITWVGTQASVDRRLVADDEIDLEGALVTPGLIDAHTHPLYAGNRFSEIALRSTGASYGEISATGGGITATVAATRATTAGDLTKALDHRLEEWLAGGTTTVEAKTGYHLDETGELGAVRLLSACADGRHQDREAPESLERSANPASGEVPGDRAGNLLTTAPSRRQRPSVEVTFLAAHATGPEWAGDPDGYAREVAAWCADAKTSGARHADVFCDEGYFTIEQARLILGAAKTAGLLLRIHADELALTGGAELAAELGCASADHLLRVDEAGIRALAASGVVATLAPVTALAMGKTPPARRLLEAGVTIALGSDHNPGTCGTTSMSLVIALAVAELGLSVGEALWAATAGGACSLRLGDRGRIAPGLRADLVAWDAEHEGAFAWSYGLAPISLWRQGHRS